MRYPEEQQLVLADGAASTIPNAVHVERRRELVGDFDPELRDVRRPVASLPGDVLAAPGPGIAGWRRRPVVSESRMTVVGHRAIDMDRLLIEPGWRRDHPAPRIAAPVLVAVI